MRNKFGGHTVLIGEIRNAYKTLVGNLKERDSVGHKHRWEVNIKMDLKRGKLKFEPDSTCSA
jgi:hypothetical protein